MKNLFCTLFICNFLVTSMISCKQEEVLLQQPQETKLTNVGTINTDDPEAVTAFQKMVGQLTVSRVAAEDKILADNYNKLGISEDLKGQYQLALSYHSKALEIRKTLGNRADLAKSYNNIAVVYRMMGNATLATTNYLRAISFADDKVCKAHTYRNYGLLLQDQKKYAEARDQYQVALSIWKLFNNQTRINILLQDLQIINSYLSVKVTATAIATKTKPGQGGVERLY